jgi:hypothetical protein
LVDVTQQELDNEFRLANVRATAASGLVFQRLQITVFWSLGSGQTTASVSEIADGWNIGNIEDEKKTAAAARFRPDGAQCAAAARARNFPSASGPGAFENSAGFTAAD